MSEKFKTEVALKALLTKQRLAALATSGKNGPYLNLVAFAPGLNLQHIFFATARTTQKYENIRANPEISLLIDSRSNQPADFHRAAAVTAIGSAGELRGRDREEARKIYLARHPHLDDFTNSPSCAFFRVLVKTYVLVRDFQRVDLIEP